MSVLEIVLFFLTLDFLISNTYDDHHDHHDFVTGDLFYDVIVIESVNASDVARVSRHANDHDSGFYFEYVGVCHDFAISFCDHDLLNDYDYFALTFSSENENEIVIVAFVYAYCCVLDFVTDCGFVDFSYCYFCRLI